MRVIELRRYPVKSLQGESVGSARLTANGLEGDRRFAIFDAETGLGLTGRRVPELLFASARLLPGGRVEITLPDGSIAMDDGALSDWLGRRVMLRSTDEVAERRFENVVDFEHEESSEWDQFDGAATSFRDSEAAVISLVSTGSLRDWSSRRFRPNVVLDGDGEDELVGGVASVGGARLGIVKQLGRCVVVTRAQPDGVERDLDVLRTLHRERGGKLCVGATVLDEGVVDVGDELLATTAVPAL